jgi:hypothetical protein
MKTYTRTVLSVVAALSMLPTVVSAGGNGAKGGAADLMRKPTAVVDAPKTVTMSCPKCKTEYAVKKDWTERGANKSDKVVGKHLCDTCSTELKTVGVGKHAKDVATHTCVACKN